MRRLLPLIAALSVAAPASAAVPSAPIALPGDGRAVAAASATWIVGARPGAAAARVARAFAAEEVAPGAYVVARARARALAAALRAAGLLTFAESDRLSTLRQERAVPDDPLSPQARWRDVVAAPNLAPPAVTPESPLLALIDSKADASHPDLGGGAFTAATGSVVRDFHGTATAAVASAPVNGQGITGIWPGMRTLNLPLPRRIACSDSARGIRRAIAAGAAVINMSYGSPVPCYAEFLGIQRATARGVSVVAAAGNEFADGNPQEFPASLPHVITVAASTPDGRAAFFSNENAAIDLSAPGVGILTAVPVAHDPDDTKDGYAGLDGTSFAAPMVAAGAAWLRAARPDLTVDQVAQVVRLSARDLGRKGWDAATGFGQLDVGAALTREPPPADPGEPNEDIGFVDGRAFGRRQAPVYSGTATALFALLDVYEDPSDVYRLRIPARTAVRVTSTPRFGDPDLEAYSEGARGIGEPRDRIARSRRRGRRSDTVRLRNADGRTRTFYVRAHIGPRRRSLDAAYTLRIRKG